MGNSVARVNGQTYKILGTLGEGGSATVYEVRRGKRNLALKWVRGVSEPDVLERLLLEIQVHRQLQHPHILPLVDAEVRACGEHDDEQAGSARSRQQQGGYTHGGGHMAVNSGSQAPVQEVLMLFPIFPHGSLQTLLEDAFQKENAPFSESECLRFFSDLVDAVRELHGLGFTHRDLKPGNILLSSSNPVQPVLMDFGSLAPLNTPIRNASDHIYLCEDAERFSSAPYRPPELWQSNGYVPNSVFDGRTDVWQLGCVLYAMAFGPYSPFEHPREGVQHLAILNGNVRFPAHNFRFNKTFSSSFTSFIKWMLIPDIASRPTLGEVREQLQLLRSNGRETMTPLTTTSSTTNSYSNDYQHQEYTMSRPPPTQILSFSKLASDEWADFAAYEKVSKSPSISMHSSEDWGEFTGFERSNSTSVLSTSRDTLVWSTDSIINQGPGQNQTLPQQNKLLGSYELVHNTELRRALSTRGRMLLTHALDGRSAPHAILMP
uniref:non-specific serine/threonine protein kinase n=1 Tax=Globisporangium ultimum (strain ATCC 200006 / CBS 805.95 / DAOM BR144) TaxID=431595 RepID=K3X701_GLOUD